MGPRLPTLLSCALLLAGANAAVDLFDWEKIQLSEDALHSSVGARGIAARAANSSCKVFPGDAEWPSADQWSALNETLEGALIKSVPHASVCYQGPYYDEAACTTITANWTNSYIQ